MNNYNYNNQIVPATSYNNFNAQPPRHQQMAQVGNAGYPVTQQPIGMGGNPMFNPNAPGPDDPNWQIGLFDCFNNCGTCAVVFFCEPIAECIAANKINENCCYPALFGVIPVSVRFRTLHRIEMGMCEEACCWTFCRLCMLCRLLNEMRVRGHN